MNIINFFIFILLVFTTAACQIKEKSAAAGLVSGHVPVTNSFTVTGPNSGTYTNAGNLNFVLSFPYAVTVTGTPQLALTIGATTRYANYLSGSGTKNLTFRYTVVAGDNDTDGITLNSLGLNSGTLNFTNLGVTTACDITSVTTKIYTNVLVDNTAPSISSFVLSNLPGLYRVGSKINFAITFSEAVYVSGSPYVPITLTTGGTVNATYSGGSGTTILAFSYTLTSADQDIDGLDAITSPINLNSGTISDLAGNASALTFSSAAALTQSLTTLFDGTVPYVVTVRPPSNGTYLSAQNLDLQLDFDRAVTVTGSPYISITVGTNTTQAAYFSGSGTTTLVFRYTTVPGDSDNNGISYATNITANSGTIVGTSSPTTSYFSLAANNSFNVPTTTGILVGATQPLITAITRNTDTTLPTWGAAVADNYWINGQTLTLTASFNTPVWVSQVGGTPSIPLTIGATTRQATYLSGGNGQTNLVFTYTVQSTDLDTDGSIAIGSINLNGGVIYDANSTNSLLTMPSPSISSTYVDGVAPTINSITPPANNTYSVISGNDNTTMDFTINWSEPVNYSSTTSGSVYIPMTIGATAVNAQYLSGNNSSSLIHQPTALTGLNDLDGITLTSPIAGSATIKDLAGNTATTLTYTLPNTSSIFVDTTDPIVSSVTPPADGSYGIGDNLDYVVTFSESVTTTKIPGFPNISITVGSSSYVLEPVSSSTSSTHTFRYTIQANDVDNDGVVIGNSVATAVLGEVKDAGQNLISGTFSPPSTPNVLVDGVAPYPVSETPPANGTYQSGDVISFDVLFSENVTVTGTPRIQVAAQTGTLNLNYASGSGTSLLTFSYTVTASDFDFDGLSSSITTIALNGGTILDGAGNNATLSLSTTHNLSSLFIAYPNTVVWTTNNFTNRAATGGITLSSAGAVTSQACGTGTCRTFDGDDTLTLSGAVNSVATAYVVFTTPSSVALTDLFVNDFTLSDDTTVFDIALDGTINLDGSLTTGTTHNVNMATSSHHIIQIDYTTAANFAAGDLIPTGYTGAIGEVILVTGSLSAGQKTEILNYLNTKY